MKIPPVEAGMKIGLYGGSFNPPHQGHRHLAETALKRFQLDQIWWMVTPGNPLKEKQGLKPLLERMEQSRALIRHPRIHVTGFEANLRTTLSAETVAFLCKHYAHVHFVWLMGADNLETFHLWQQWRTLAKKMPLGIIDRPGSTMAPLTAPAARILSRFRLSESRAVQLGILPPPAWCFLHAPRLDISSSFLRLRALSENQP